MTIAPAVNTRDHTHLAWWEKLRFYLRFLELLFSFVVSSLVFKCLHASRYPDKLLSNNGSMVTIRLSYHFFQLFIGVFTINYSFLSMLQTLAQGRQYQLPKWLVFTYLTFDGLLIVFWAVGSSLVASEKASDSESLLSLNQLACLSGATYSFDWPSQDPDAIDYPLICTFSSVAATLGWFMFFELILSFFLTLYLRYKWGKLRP
ncbi:hypothetical protein DSO57_1022085 [Entomophthora muscae]|uniref:Uncharacterized protein n=1 Tax=Entomophthora muscae TaxID=34485 RepID=A0ACC2SG91_9FUNG|nr:hypothetical protein DSO57_1022085 [Entomophthora muscae]